MASVISLHAACRLFSHAVWDIDHLGLIAARFIVDRLLPAAMPITVVVDDTLVHAVGAHGPSRVLDT